MYNLYEFVYRGILTEESLDKSGRKHRNSFGPEEAIKTRTALSYELLDAELMANAQKTSLIYAAIHAFENMVRHFVKTGLAEAFQEQWWSHVSSKIQEKVKSRMEDEVKFKWHGARGGSEIEYCDFGDLSSIIATNWQVFEAVIVDLEWAKSILSVLERSRNIVMHGGNLARQDVERIGMNIRDWIRQVG